MSDGPPAPPGDLQFDKAEPTDGTPPPAAVCASCTAPLVGSYYQVNGQPACERCKAQAELDQMSGSGAGNFLRAGAFGFLAALAGGALWYAVRAGTGYEVGLIAVVVGVMVGAAVRAGGRRRGGRLYQVLAVALTYFGICIQYVPDIVKAIRDAPPPAAAAPATGGPATATPVATPASETPSAPDAGAPTLSGALLALVFLVGFAMAAPFLAGFENIIGILIIGFALWEAWRINRHVPLQIEGPFRLGTAPNEAEPR